MIPTPPSCIVPTLNILETYQAITGTDELQLCNFLENGKLTGTTDGGSDTLQTLEITVGAHCQTRNSYMLPEHRPFIKDVWKISSFIANGNYTGPDLSQRVRLVRPNGIFQEKYLGKELTDVFKDMNYFPVSEHGFRFFTVMDDGHLTLRYLTLVGGRGSRGNEQSVALRAACCDEKQPADQKNYVHGMCSGKCEGESLLLQHMLSDLTTLQKMAVSNMGLDFEFNDEACSCITPSANWFKNQGGAVMIEGSGTALFEYVTFEQNSADQGGAVFVSTTSTSTLSGAPDVKFHHVLFDRNQATNMLGSGALHIDAPSGKVVVVDSTFVGNFCGDDLHYVKHSGGGALWLDNTTNIQLSISGSGDNVVTCPRGTMGTMGTMTSTTDFECETCEAGRYHDSSSGATECQECPFGKKLLSQSVNMYYHHLSIDNCEFCKAGTYDQEDSLRSDPCVVCEKGKWKGKGDDKTSQLPCRKCLSGFYLGDSGHEAEVVQDDAAMKHDTQEDCEMCPEGQLTGGNSTQPVQVGAHYCGICAAGFYLRRDEDDGSSFCDTCLSGRYRNGRDDDGELASRCKVCPAGFAQKNKQSSACDRCSPGEYTNETGSTVCAACAINRFSDKSEAKKCEMCWPGFSTEGRPKKGSNDPGMNWCLPCAGGRFSPRDKWGADCQQCPLGFFKSGVNNTDSCVGEWIAAMEATKNSNDTIADAAKKTLDRLSSSLEKTVDRCSLTSCSSCPVGWFGGTVGGSQCNVCPRGYVQPLPQQVACQICKKGTYADRIGEVACVDCLPGSYSDTKGRSKKEHCQTCPAGYYSNEDGVSKCTSCARGFYHEGKDSENTWPCVRCGMRWATGGQVRLNIGEFSNDTGVKSCQLCPLGRFTNATGATDCQNCPIGWYLDEPGKNTCKRCTSGVMDAAKFQHRGASSLSDCESGLSSCKEDVEFLDDSSHRWQEWRCEPCNSGVRGTICTGFPKLSDTNLTHVENYWTVPWWKSSPENFQKCPFKNSCGTSIQGCRNNTQGVLCASCSPEHFRNSVGACLQCTPGTVLERGGIVMGFLLLLVLIATTQRRRCRRLQRKYGEAWRDFLRIITIQVNYAQINASLPMIIEIPWPNVYLNFLDSLAWVNVDVVGILGIECIEDIFWDYRARVGLACAVPAIIVATAGIMFLVRVRSVDDRTRRDAAVRAGAVEYMYDIVDTDQSMEIDLQEFAALLKQNKNDQSRRRKSVVQMMQDLGAHEHIGDDDDEEDKNDHVIVVEQTRRSNRSENRNDGDLVLTREEFVKAAASGKLSTVIGNQWISSAEKARMRSSYCSGVLLLLFLLHAPISQRLFYYFVCQDVGNCSASNNGGTECRQFLKADFRMECHLGIHNQFAPFVWIMMLCFTCALPLVVGMQLWRFRHRLQSVIVKHKLGFLYAPFNQGAEFWELHELGRKLVLTGMLIFVSEKSPRTAAAILVCATAVATLHYYRPHKNRIVFNVAQASFLLSTFKYVSTLLIEHADVLDQLDSKQGQQSSNGIVSRKHQIGVVLVLLDVVFFVGSMLAGVAAMVVVRTSIKKAASNHEQRINLLKEKRKSRAMVHPTTKHTSRGTQGAQGARGGNEERRHSDSMNQFYRKQIIDKLTQTNKLTLSEQGQKFISKVVTADKAHSTQEMHQQSKARVVMKMNKKKLNATRRLENRLMIRSKSKRLGGAKAAAITGAVVVEKKVAKEKVVEKKVVEKKVVEEKVVEEKSVEKTFEFTVNSVRSSVAKLINTPVKLKKAVAKLTDVDDRLNHKRFCKLASLCCKKMHGGASPSVEVLNRVWESASIMATGDGHMTLDDLERWLYPTRGSA